MTSNDDNNRLPIEHEEMSNCLTQQDFAVDNFLHKDEEKISRSFRHNKKVPHKKTHKNKITAASVSDDTSTNERKSDSKKKPRWTWKKPKGKPCRPMSAYNFFFKCERQRIISEHKKSGGFSKLAQVISARWNSLSSEDRRIYQQQADREKIKYHNAIQEWQNQNDQQIDNRILRNQNDINMESEIEISVNPSSCQMTDTEEQHSSVSSSAKISKYTISDTNFFGSDYFLHYDSYRKLDSNKTGQEKRSKSLDLSMPLEQASTKTNHSNYDSHGCIDSIKYVTQYDKYVLNQYKQNTPIRHLQANEDRCFRLKQPSQQQQIIPENSSEQIKLTEAHRKRNESDGISALRNGNPQYKNEAFFHTETKPKAYPDDAFNEKSTVAYQKDSFINELTLEKESTPNNDTQAKLNDIVYSSIRAYKNLTSNLYKPNTNTTKIHSNECIRTTSEDFVLSHIDSSN